VRVFNAASDSDARLASRAICDSLLCKTAWFGCDPNWGRVLAAAGYSGAVFDPARVNLHYDGLPVVLCGVDAGTPESDLAELMGKGEFEIALDLGGGGCSHVMWTSDLSYEYVRINADYHT
ncbi:MAG: bifunctional ornithine acetyltransferase/N-acetylglutamate synthase, partial [Victivallales bacterium]|nr:bifunctional ornithine acetyltransferase/N-acetylglutamate synthase [Victivallales bacterium]